MRAAARGRFHCCCAWIGVRSRWPAGSSGWASSRSATRDDLPLHLGRQAPRGDPVPAPAGRAEVAAQALGRYDSRGRLAGKRSIVTRPAAAETRRVMGHWEGDTMLGDSQAGPCVLSLVERKTGYLALGPLRRRTSAQVNRRARRLIRRQPHPVQTSRVDNGTELHEYAALERTTAARFYFATPHHAWERETNENTNGLIRQYLSHPGLGNPSCHSSQGRRLRRMPLSTRCPTVRPNGSRTSCSLRRPQTEWTCSTGGGRRGLSASCAG
jgi:hypothetical protein